MDYQQLLLDNLELIDRVVHYVARRHHLHWPDVEEFSSIVRIRLLDKDYAVLRKFQGRSNLATYLTTVIERIYLDYCIAQWGKWRPSAAARRLGPVAVLLEQLVVRDGHPFEEAATLLETNHHVSHSRAELRYMLAQLPARPIRRPAGEEELELVAARGGAPDPAFDKADDLDLLDRVEAALIGALESLDSRDRLLIKLRFLDEMPATSVARLLEIEVKPLYRRLAHVLCDLRTALQRSGVTEAEIARIVGHPAVTLGRVLRSMNGPPDNPGARPSKA